MTEEPDSPGKGPEGRPPETDPLLVPRVARCLVEPPGRGKVLVVAPHPDDEAIGPGATLALHNKLGDGVVALFVTSGVHGDLSESMSAAEYVKTRRREAENSAKVLGIGKTVFWEYPDSMVVTQGDMAGVVERMVQLLEEENPDVIYAPHLGEQHSDHHLVGLMVQQALEGWDGTARAFGYEVWSPLDADIAVDVEETYPVKLDAIRCYASQLEHQDICSSVEGLNRYRAVLLPPGGVVAEAFEDWSSEESA